MNWLIHPIPNIILGMILYNLGFITTPEMLVLFISFSILIDIDHFLYYSIKYRNKSLKQIIEIRNYNYIKKQPSFFIFHSPEFNILILILSFFNHYALLLLISNIMHISLDIPVQNNKFKCLKNWSIIYNIKNARQAKILPR